ncbi:MAG TPA: GNAT family N-acetyltransferase [Rhodanobacteraceae bacterium]|nr:GNAT family N-acetyltransferase [Rhodanobacteraceae bacterium]
MLTLRSYTAADAATWDAVVERSRNGNLLHRRAYMDYHADRFLDCSLIVERKGSAVAVFPASLHDGVVTSHAGLSYAGLIMTQALGAERTLEVFNLLGEHYRAHGVQCIVYKAIPHVFHRYPAEEDLYALHRLGASLVRRDVSSVIPLRQPSSFSPARERAVARARKAGIRLQSGGDPAAFHQLLARVLRRHSAVPTHSLEELRLLQARFPGRIVLHEARGDAGLLAGAVTYDFGHVVHTQYLAASGTGRRCDALSLLLAELMGSVYADRAYFSFGISTERGGSVLNTGLAAHKERFGARTVVHDFYEWAL